MFSPICRLSQRYFSHLKRKIIAWQHLNYQGNLSEHAKRVYHALARFGKSVKREEKKTRKWQNHP
jgi:hypothetical protein